MNFGKSNVEKAQDTVAMYGKRVTNGIENAVDTAHDAAQGALSGVSNQIDSLHDQAKPTVDRLVARGQEMASSAIEGTKEVGARAKKAVSGYANACETYVSEQPLKSVAIAAAAGATIAALILMSRNRGSRLNSARYNDR